MSRWVGIVAASLRAISAMFLVPCYPVWALISLGLAALVIYGLAAHYGEKPDRWSVATGPRHPPTNTALPAWACGAAATIPVRHAAPGTAHLARTAAPYLVSHDSGESASSTAGVWCHDCSK